MPRFAGSGERGSTAARLSSRPEFQGPSNRMRSSGGFGAAAGMTDVAGIFQANRERAPRFDQMSATNIQNRGAERSAATRAEAQVAGAGISALGQVRSARIQADAAVEAAEKRAAAAGQSAIMGGIGSVLSAGLGLLSDAATKDSVERIDDALVKLRQLKPVTFYYKEEYSSSPERMHHGFIAQDFQKVVPDATYYDESTGKLCIDTVDLIGLLVRGIQQLEARVTRLEAEKALVGVK